MQQRHVVSTHLDGLAHDLLCLSIGVHLRIVVAASGCSFGLATGKFQRDMSDSLPGLNGLSSHHNELVATKQHDI
jgi:hypothetical protein